MLITIYCAPNGGTLYLITGTSQFKFEEILNLQDKMTGVDKSVQPMEWVHDNVDIYPALGPEIAIPNSMWTVGCCWKDNYGVVGAFGVMGDNYFKPFLNEFMMPTQTVAYVREVLRLEHPKLKLELFPGVEGKDCYEQGKKRSVGRLEIVVARIFGEPCMNQIHMKSKFSELVFSSVRLINLHANLSTQK